MAVMEIFHNNIWNWWFD